MTDLLPHGGWAVRDIRARWRTRQLAWATLLIANVTLLLAAHWVLIPPHDQASASALGWALALSAGVSGLCAAAALIMRLVEKPTLRRKLVARADIKPHQLS